MDTGVRDGCDCICLLQVGIGNADYSCSCVRYVTSVDATDHTTSTDYSLIIGLAVGLGVPLIIIIILIIVAVVCCRRRGKSSEERITYSNNDTGLVHLDQDDGKYYNVASAPKNNANQSFS